MAEQEQPRRETMSSAERMGAILRRERPDRVPFMPFIFGFCARNVGYPIRDFYEDAEKSFWCQMWTQEMYGYDGGPNFGYASVGGWEFGGEIKIAESEWEQAPVVTRFPAQTPGEVEALEIPDVETAGFLPIAIEFARIQQKFGMPITVKILPAFTCAGNIAEVDVLCRWIIRRPEVVHKLMRKITHFAKLVIDYYVDKFAGQPMMASVGDATSANQVISPGHFEEFVLPYQREIHEHAVERGIEHIFCHICGEQNLNLPYWVQIPFGNPGILSFGHEVDLETAIEYFGDQHAIAGNIEPRVIQEGSWQEVYDLCRIAIEKAKYAPSGYLLMAGCEVPVQAPPYTLYVMKKAVTEFGFFD